jgi:hypothetical protein
VRESIRSAFYENTAHEPTLPSPQSAAPAGCAGGDEQQNKRGKVLTGHADKTVTAQTHAFFLLFPAVTKDD